MTIERAGGLTDIRPDGLEEVGAGLTGLADTLGNALQAVDSVPVDAVAPVLGPVGTRFTQALLAATSRHRQVLSDCTRVAAAAGDLVAATATVYREVDAGGARSIEGVAAPMREV